MNRGVSRWARMMMAAFALAFAGWSPTLAASPSPSAGAAGDPRSSGEGPGLIGDPLTAIAVVLATGLASVALTYLYVRLTAGRPRP